MLGGEVGQPRVELAVAQLDDAVAPRAHEVVMMPLAAQAVARLTAVVGERVDDAALATSLLSVR